MTTEQRMQKIKKAVAGRQKDLILVLEKIHDPHNAAAIFRSAEDFGVQKVCLIFESGAEFNPRKVGKVSSASANKWLDFEKYKSTSVCLNSLKKQGYKIAVTILDEQAESIYQTDWSKGKTALVIGNEHRGVSRSALKLADSKIYIPMRGLVQSLNVSVTAGICLYEITRQRLVSGKKMGLNKSELLNLEKDYSSR